LRGGGQSLEVGNPSRSSREMKSWERWKVVGEKPEGCPSLVRVKSCILKSPVGGGELMGEIVWG
jgi:hypothetical protein